MSNRLLTLIAVFFLPITILAQAQTGLYSQAFGDTTKPPVIFLHGGPGYNCAGFEITTAKNLANKGFFVIVYDQRGCGRSKDMPGPYNMANNLNDLDSIYNRYHISSATLLGHSWGGTLGMYYADKYPKKVARLVLVSSPISYPQTLRTIQKNCKNYFEKQNDSNRLTFLKTLSSMDTSALSYATYSFSFAVNCGFYKPLEPTRACKDLYAMAAKDKDARLLNLMEFPPMQGLHSDIHYTTLNLTSKLNDLKKKGVLVFGIYGTDDGLFDDNQRNEIKDITSDAHFTIIPGASHNVFIDQQQRFFETFMGYMTNQ